MANAAEQVQPLEVQRPGLRRASFVIPQSWDSEKILLLFHFQNTTTNTRTSSRSSYSDSNCRSAP